MEYKCKELVDVIEYSESMLKEAEAGNWEKVIAMEKKRDDRLKKIFSLAFSNSEKERNNEIILQILSINKQLESITSKARDTRRDQAGAISKGRQAVGIYAQHVG